MKVYSQPKARCTLTAKQREMLIKCKKQKRYSEVFYVTFFAIRDTFSLNRIVFSMFCISQHFAPGSAFLRNVKGFHGLCFRGIN